MSKIGQLPITIPENVTVTLTGNQAEVAGPKGKLSLSFSPMVKVVQKDNQILVTVSGTDRRHKIIHGTTRSLLSNLVTGVTQGYQRSLELVGTGYRVVKQDDKLVFSLGFSHPVEIATPQGITFEVQGNNQITVSGIDAQLVGQTAASLRALRPPEPYKGKGIRYQGEVVRRKAGKAAKVGGAA